MASGGRGSGGWCHDSDGGGHCRRRGGWGPTSPATGRGEEERLIEALTKLRGTAWRPSREVRDVEINKGVREEGGAVFGKGVTMGLMMVVGARDA